MKICINSTLKVGEIVDLNLVNNNEVEILSWGKVVEILPVLPFKNLFARRKTFKANVIEPNKLNVIRYYDLHRHSGYSVLDGMNKIPAIVENTEYAGALTDHGVMFGILEYYKKMKSANKLPILGFEAYTESISGLKNRNHLVLIAQNEKGFKNLIKLTSKGYTNYYKRPHLSYEMLRDHSEGVICSTACMGGEIPRLLRDNKKDDAKKVALEFINIFGKDNFYIELQKHNIEGEAELNLALVDLAKELDVKVIATTDSHYTNEEDSKYHEVVLCLQTGKTMDDPKRLKFDGQGYHLHTSDEMERLWCELPEALDNTIDLVESINLELDLNNVYMPDFPVPDGFENESKYFEYLCWQGFEKRFKGTDKFINEEYKERLQFEIDTINQMGFPGYFLIVWDFVKYAKDNGILCGPGRGSACGSLVAYTLWITEVDPIRYGLLFERFLNPDRISMPDIDMDFSDERREEVIEYVEQKYGKDAVSRIVTFGTLAPRMAVRDIARVLNKPYSLGDKIAKAIPKEPKITLAKALKQSQELANMYETDSEVKKIIEIAKKIEGLPRNISQHACGVIISKGAVDDYIPQLIIKDDKTGMSTLATQFVMTECEEMGLLKMDFLGLRTMGVCDNALIDINKKRKSQNLESIEFLEIPTNDVEVYNFIAKGNTEGVFQLESPGMTSFMSELFQDTKTMLNTLSKESLYIKGKELFERIIAGISLYRPGPIDEIPHYIENMLNPDGIIYELDELEHILRNTYNVIVYQEQCMFIVRELAGFSKGQADTIRKGMSKKKDDLLDEYEEYFVYGSAKRDETLPDNKKMNIKGCVNNGISAEVAKGIYAKMKKFGAYAFNKSHAGGYAEISIRTGWMAYYYPTEYMCATLNSFIDKNDKIKLYMSVCKKKKINILPPDVNLSEKKFCVDGDAIRFGLRGIKQMGEISGQIIDERNKRGLFIGYQDFAERMSKYQQVSKKVLEGLIFSGAIDGFEGTRREKVEILPQILKVASNEKKNYQSGQITLFDSFFDNEDNSLKTELEELKSVKLPALGEYDKRYKLEKEKEFAGFYVTEHPLDEYVQILSEQGIYELGFLSHDNDDEDSLEYSLDGENVKVA